MIEITKETISLEQAVSRTKTNSRGCVVTYVGVIRDYSQDKPVLSVEYQDYKGNAGRHCKKLLNKPGKGGDWKT